MSFTAWIHSMTSCIRICMFGLESALCMYPELEKVINCTTRGGQALCFFLFQLKLLLTNTHVFTVFPFNDIFSFDMIRGSDTLLLLRPYKAVVLVPVWHAHIPPLKPKPERRNLQILLRCSLVKRVIMQTRLFTLDYNQYLGAL